MFSRATRAGITILVLSSLLLFVPSSAFATDIERAEGLELSKAVGHWSRARTHMLSALREFDKGNSLVNPDALIDASEVRSRILAHIQALDRVIDPQPRATEGGVRFGAAPELLGEQ